MDSMSDVQTGRASATEIAALNADLAVRMRDRVPGAPLAPDQPRGDAARRARRPLGLAPAPGDDGPGAEFDRSVHPIVASALVGITEAGRQAPATVENTFVVLDVALQADDELRSHIVALRDQVSELKAALIEARHEVRELKLIQESLRISTRGESGRDGVRGVPGRDGQQGPIGPRGERGDKGLPAPRLATWNIDEDRFIATPVFGDGSTGAPLNLLPLFASYDRAVQELEDRDLTEAAAASRARNEAEVAAHWSK